MNESGYEEIHLGTYEQLKEQVQRIQKEYKSQRLYFRGQADSDWKLATTFERWLDNSPGYFSVSAYLKIALRAKFQIEAFTSHKWDGVNIDEVDNYGFEYDQMFEPIPLYSNGYLQYLRHHGFPSPLLDWSTSFNVATYFAFSSANAGTYDGKRVALYIYCDMPEGAKSFDSGSPLIKPLGPYATGHKRHFLQESCYTVCLQMIEGRMSFVPHEKVFRDPERYRTQDFLWKLILPASERSRALAELDSYNLNSYSLFQTEDSMLEVLAFREKQHLLKD